MDDPQWLETKLRQGLVERWCLKRSCTTCGSYEMAALLTGHEVSDFKSYHQAYEQMTWRQAERIIDGLRHCDGEDIREAIMWLLYTLWLRWGEMVHEKLFPALGGTFSAEVLDAMRRHYAYVNKQREIHEKRQGVKQKDWIE